MNNIILIGMPGAGKSTVGVVFAKIAGFGFIDSDLVIQTETKKRLSDLLNEYGADGFKEMENRINSGIWADRCVIATGGSVVYGKEAMEHLKSLGTVVYLQLSYPEISKRLGDLRARGVVIREGMTLWDLYNERVSLYEQYADIIIDCDDKGVEAAALALFEKVKDKL